MGAEMKGKRVLIFYPHNFYEMSSGTHRRFYNLLVYFKDRGFSMDLLSMHGFTNGWGEQDVKRKDFFETTRVSEWRPSFSEQLRHTVSSRTKRLHDFTGRRIRSDFRDMAGTGRYSFIFVSYVYWAALADCAGDDVVKVIDLHDFITLNTYTNSGAGVFRLGRMFEDEVRAISKFEYALSISEEETVTLSPFCLKTAFVNVPVSFPRRFHSEAHEFDLLYVGSDNPFNRKGIEWFMKGVYPLLPPSVRIAVVGKICEYVKKRDNIAMFPSTGDLGGIYERSRIALCPLFGGTGLKIKVVEALSCGKPVVTTSWGLKGILQKHDNGCLLADGERDFADAVLLLINNDSAYGRLKRQAESFFMNNYSTEVVYKNLDAVFLNAYKG